MMCQVALAFMPGPWPLFSRVHRYTISITVQIHTVCVLLSTSHCLNFARAVIPCFGRAMRRRNYPMARTRHGDTKTSTCMPIKIPPRLYLNTTTRMLAHGLTRAGCSYKSMCVEMLFATLRLYCLIGLGLFLGSTQEKRSIPECGGAGCRMLGEQQII